MNPIRKNKAMRLGALCQQILDIPTEWETLPISGVAYDSRNVQRGDLFVAVPGLKEDGSRFADEAVRKGAAVVVSEKTFALPVPLIVARNARKILALLANRFYGDLSRRIPVIGVTGTNGKTTTAFFMESVLRQSGLEPGLLGTVLVRWKGKENKALHTTPESVDLHRTLREMTDEGVKAVVMEVSSHALALDRVYGMTFRAALFTNLTQDHLDFHGNLDAYADAKSVLFGMVDPKGIAVINADDPFGERMRSASKGRTVTYGTGKTTCDYRIKNLRHSLQGTTFVLSHGSAVLPISLGMWGRFNAMNAAAAAACALELNLDRRDVLRGIQAVKHVPGRMEGMVGPSGVKVIIDFAHTPDALDNVLGAVREFTKGKVIVVFGCGGDRDRTKRPLMGGIAAKRADRVIVTSDNPRSENPESIIQDILKGIKASGRVESIADREQAIQKAIAGAGPNDTVVVAGKGHETHQDIGGQLIPFDDRRVVETHFARFAGL